MKTRTERKLWFYGIRFAFILIFALGAAQTGWAWGRTGHRLVARIAEKMISSSAEEEIARILEGESMADVALWADQIKKERPETAVWHYVKFSMARDGKENVPELDGSSILTAISNLTYQLESSDTSATDRREALMFLIHLVGDLHQPMHCAPDGDVGGNAVSVTFFDKETNLHKVWDSSLLEELSGSEDEQLAYLEHSWAETVDRDRESVDLIRWATESNQVARQYAYTLPANNRLGESYVQSSLSPCSRQVWLAGIRLAKVLDSIFSKTDEVQLTACSAIDQH